MDETFEELKERFRIEEKRVLVIDYNDWDRMINELFKDIFSGYEIVACEELNNDSTYSYDLNELMASEDRQSLYAELQTSIDPYPSYCTGTIIDILIAEGILPTGYVLNVDICW